MSAPDPRANRSEPRKLLIYLGFLEMGSAGFEPEGGAVSDERTASTSEERAASGSAATKGVYSQAALLGSFASSPLPARQHSVSVQRAWPRASARGSSSLFPWICEWLHEVPLSSREVLGLARCFQRDQSSTTSPSNRRKSRRFAVTSVSSLTCAIAAIWPSAAEGGRPRFPSRARSCACHTAASSS